MDENNKIAQLTIAEPTPYAKTGDELYKKPESAGPTIPDTVQTAEYIAIICGSPPAGANTAASGRMAGAKNPRDTPNSMAIKKIGTTLVG
jgi:hypothetical protein